MHRGILAILTAVIGILLALTQVFLKRLVVFWISSQGGLWSRVFLAFNSFLPWAVLLGSLVSVGLWLWILPKAKLSTVYPMISISYVAMLFFAYFLEHEPIRWFNIAGTALILGGIAVLSLGR